MHPLIRNEPDPDHPGWSTWDIEGGHCYNASIGRLLVKPDGPGRGRCRIFPDAGQGNLGNVVHGGAILTFIDIAMFAGGQVAGMSDTSAVTLDCSVQFIGAGELGKPLDAVVELLRETGRLVFYRGTVEQDERIVAAFSGTLRKIRAS